MTTRVLRVDVDGQLRLHHPGDLRGWQALVGGWLEGIYGPGWCGYINETGLLDGLRINPVASILIRDAGALGYGLVCGPVVFFGPADANGDATDVPQPLLDRAAELAELGTADMIPTAEKETP